MAKLTRADLYSLEEYAAARAAFRARVMIHKQSRRLAIGPNAILHFEDRLTIHYQVQEMLRIEKIFEAAAIDEELAAYNPLLPDGRNWKATFMLEYDDPQERKARLARLVGVEAAVWLRVGGGKPIEPICNEDLPRATAAKTSSVHFMRFELSEEDAAALGQGAALSAGVSHPEYRHSVAPVPALIRHSLARDILQP